MLNTQQEKQDAITARDWASLVQSNLFRDFDFNTSTYESYTFDKDFILEFVFNVARHTAHNEFLRTNMRLTYFTDDVMRHVFERISNLGITFTTDEWLKIISATSDLAKTATIVRSAAIYVLSLNGKDVNYLRALLDDVTYRKIQEIKISSIGASRSKLDISEFNKLSLDEQRQIIPRLNFGTGYPISSVNGDVSDLAHLASTPEETVKLAWDLGVNVSELLQNTDPDTYTNMLIGLNDSETGVQRIARWGSYYENHTYFKLSDGQLDKLFDVYNSVVFRYVINNITDDQLVKNAAQISTRVLFKRDGLTLSRVSELLGDNNTDLTGHRFFTEEEIRDNPQFFDPKSVIDTNMYYVSPDTFKLLNKTWGKRIQYRGTLTTLDVLISKNLSIGSLASIETLRYLVQKTGASNDVLTSIVLREYIDPRWNEDCRKLSAVKDFLKRSLGNRV